MAVDCRLVFQHPRLFGAVHDAHDIDVPELRPAFAPVGGPQFGNVNIMGVMHGTEKPRVLEHKAAIDRHLAAVGIPVSYTNVFWGGRSEIKPSEISPKVYAEWHAKHGG